MTEREANRPVSPTMIGLQTGMAIPGLENVRGPLEEALVAPPAYAREEHLLEVIPGQSGAEGLAELPHGGAGNPWDGP